MATNSHTSIQEIMEKRFPLFLEDLKALVKIPSISFPGFPASETRKSAEAVAALFKKRGLENVELLEFKDAPPYVYADRMKAPGKPTLLLYAHHDVQPPGRPEVWQSPPFEPTHRPGPGGDRLYGRGAADDKAGVIVHAAAIAALLEVYGELPVNVKVLIEGEEEMGSPNLEEFLKEYREKLDADILVLTDTSNFDIGVPSLTVALRGLVGVGVEVRALAKTVHSGMWGGPVPDPVIALCKMLADLVDSEGRIAIEAIRNQCPPLSPEEEKEFKQIPQTDDEFRKQSGMVPSAKLLKQGPSPIAQTWRFPSLTVTAIQASSRAQAPNIINDTAWAKVTIRIARGMNPASVVKHLEEYLRARVPWGLELHLETETATPSWETETQGPVFEAALRALEKGYGHSVIKMGSGGTIPFVGPFAAALKGAPALLIGVEDPYTNAHGENESLLVSDLYKACLSQAYLFEEIGRLPKARS